MSDAELIESLRLWNRDEAADRIEALTKERDREKAYAFQCAINLDTALEQLTADRIEALLAPARVRPMTWVQSVYFPAVSVAWCPVLEKHFYAEKPGDRERVEAKRAARILSAVITGAEGEA